MTPMPSLHILVVEDNDNLREATVELLQAHGHQATGVVCAEDVDDTPTRDLADLYVIDVNLPGEDGFKLAARIRESQPLVGIVLMTARGQLNDRLEGYSSGADNYLIKPVDQFELLACIHNLAQRLQNTQASLAASSLTLDRLAMTLTGPSGQVTLSHGESLVLAALSRAAGHKLERWQVMQLVDPKEKGLVAANLEMRISALRKKLSACGAPTGIRTLRGFGYALSCQIRVL
ncbi:response regulator transcription factor [Rhodocyclus purpureus]|uniref:response regulator transcription factor n=1 Tax=Rhodocyclus purpureus TaxID=1067 RepID=UPI001914AFC1|nr:response regulator transcription factor [Rhodocyclus purpureus]MBK5915451.1 hypothetical protein [Rhodocyclus purpureus]